MTTDITPPPTLRLAGSALLWTGLARTHVAAMTAGLVPRRALVTGPAGSGKSRLLRHLRRELSAVGATVATTHGGTDIASVAPGDVLVVDDAHLLTPAQFSALGERAADADAALVLAARPWPFGGALRDAAGELERAQPAIVLGNVTRADLHAHLEASGESLTSACVDGILSATGGASWLVAESLSIHGHSRCDGDQRHEAIHDALQDVIAHRLRAVDPAVRALIEAVCLSRDGEIAPTLHDADSLILAAYAEGLLLRNGRPVPVVRSAVQATLPIDRLIALVAAGGADDASGLQLSGIHDPRLARALLVQGDEMRSADPLRARELYRGMPEAT